jgi:hypothetical protein
LFFVLMLFYNSALVFMSCSAGSDVVLLFCFVLCPHFLFLFRFVMLCQLYTF